jgi:hypothetical protein
MARRRKKKHKPAPTPRPPEADRSKARTTKTLSPPLTGQETDAQLDDLTDDVLRALGLDGDDD